MLNECVGTRSLRPGLTAYTCDTPLSRVVISDVRVRRYHGYVVPRTYATLNGRHVPALDDCWAVLRPIAVDLEVDALRGSVAFAVDDVEVGSVPIAVDPNHGVRVSAEDRSEGLPLEGESEWRANVSTRAPRRLERKGPLFCGCGTCFCRWGEGDV